MTAAQFSYESSARTHTTALVVALVWVTLIAAWFWLEAAPWVVVVFALFTVPALFDLARNPRSGLSLSPDSLSWFSGQRAADVALSEIAHLRLDTRLDFSVRASVVLHTGRTLRIPFESTPPHRAFEDALLAAGLEVKRFHFQLFQ